MIGYAKVRYQGFYCITFQILCTNSSCHVRVQEAWKGLDEENRWKLLAMATAAAAAHHLHTEDSVDV